MGQLALFLLLSAQRAGQEGTISGQLRLNGEATSITHVYASAQPGFFDKATEDVHVLFSDVVLPDDIRGDVFELIRLGRTGQAHIVEIVIDAKGAAISGALFAREFDGMVSATGMHAFTREHLERSTIAGRLVVEPEHEFHGVRWSYDVKFSAPIPHPPSAAEIADQLSSPPARAAEAHLAALRLGQINTFFDTMTAPAAADFRGRDGEATFAQLRADMPAGAKVVELVPQTDGTILAKVEGHEQGLVIGYTFTMVLDGGAWKVTK